MKRIFLVLCLSLGLFAEDEILEKLKSGFNVLLEKSSQYGATAVDKSKEYGGVAWDKTKQAGSKSKDFTLSKTLLHSLNASFDTNYIKFESFDINGTQTNIVITLKGEEKPLEVTIKDFDWAVTKDEKYILINNMQTNANIPWINHSIDTVKNLFDGSFVVKNSFLGRMFLTTMKSPKESVAVDIDTKYKNWLTSNATIKEKFYKDMTALNAINILFEALYNKDYIDLKSVQTKDNTVKFMISFDKKEPTEITVTNYKVDTANKKSLVVFNEIALNASNKPWIESLLKHQDNKLSLPYDELLEFIGNELYK